MDKSKDNNETENLIKTIDTITQNNSILNSTNNNNNRI